MGYNVVRDANSQCGEIVFPLLVPGEEVAITYLYFPPLMAGQIRSASLPREGRPLVRLDDEQGAFALSLAVLEDLGLRVKVG